MEVRDSVRLVLRFLVSALLALAAWGAFRYGQGAEKTLGFLGCFVFAAAALSSFTEFLEKREGAKRRGPPRLVLDLEELRRRQRARNVRRAAKSR